MQFQLDWITILPTLGKGSSLLKSGFAWIYLWENITESTQLKNENIKHNKYDGDDLTV